MTEPKVRALVAGNWKMNGLRAGIAEAEAVGRALNETPAGADVMICPPATLLGPMVAALGDSTVHVGGQDCHVNVSGAFTGDVSAEMLADAGATAVIVGHSERRSLHGELDRDVRAKAEAAHRAGLSAIVCVGETAGERAAALTQTVVSRQLAGSLPDGARAANTVVAYEPVWAIGTGLTPTVEDVAKVHAAIRKALVARFGAEGQGMRILYGGSVKPQNARELMAVPDVNGALVGGASLKAADFLGIIAAYQP
ncbi:Triosephosphate isomerase [Hyphomicrobium sulfonivorans]|uniref:Triosephosphate isomerase n=1 Tax=Hyphomicrobium sulfonivorans TaxID=121290 RepID=A0A125NV84_HYPSL|nr:triose-phosphate isomerase [Hyphomicrobium sulfonivorans]KWT68998.1 Triosephosphate isomerase [Hyphomicrobium sulfonivorans]